MANNYYTRSQATAIKSRFGSGPRAHALRDKIRAAAEALKKAEARDTYGEKMRDLARRARRDIKYSRMVEQSGLLPDVWPMSAEGYYSRREMLRVRPELKALNKAFTLSEDAFKEVQEQAGVISGAKAMATLAQMTLSAVTGGGLQRVAETSANVASAAVTLNESIHTISAMFQDVYANFCKYVPIGVAAALIVAFAFWVRGSNKCPPMLWTAVCSAVAYYLGESLYDKVKAYFSEEVIEQQSAVSTLAAAVTTVLVAKHCVAPWKGFNAATMLFACGSLPRANDGLGKIFEWVVEMSQVVINRCRDLLNLPEIKFAGKYSEEIIQLIENVRDVELEELKQDHEDKPQARLTRINQLHAEALLLKRLYHGHREIAPVLDTAIRACVRLAVPLKRVVGASCGYTQQPLSVVMYGKSGVGKTTVIQNLVTTVLKEAGEVSAKLTEREASKLVFAKPFNSEYMEGYHGQPVYVLDDFMMKKMTPQDTSNGILDLMTYYSSFTQLCNMASCENKGAFPFTSKIILMTTNLTHLDEVNTSQVMLHPPAIERRVDLHYEVCVKPEFRLPGKTELDYSKLEREVAKCKADPDRTIITAYPWYVWEIFPTSWSGSGSDERLPGTGRPFYELIYAMIDGLHERKDSHVSALNSARTILESPPTPAEMRNKLLGIQEQAGRVGLDATSPEAAYKPEVRSYPSEHEDDDADTVMTEWDTFVSRDAGCDPIKEPQFFAKSVGFLREQILVIKNAFASIVKQVTDFCSKHPLLIAAVIAVGVATVSLLVKLCFAAWSWICETFFGTHIEEQSNRPKSVALRFGKMKEQGGTVDEGNHRFIYNNTFKVIVVHKDGSFSVVGQLTFTHRDYAVMPLHFIDRIQQALDSDVIDKNNTILLRSCRSAGFVVKVKVSHFLEFSRVDIRERDLCFMRLTGLVAIQKDIRKYTLNTKDLVVVAGLPCRVDTARVESNGELVEYDQRIGYLSNRMHYGKAPTLIGKTRHREWFQYEAATTEGDCGAPLCLQNSRRTDCRVWAGLHVGARFFQGNTEGFAQAYATVITREIIENAVEKLTAMTKDPVVAEASFADTCEQAGIVRPKGFDIEETDRMPFSGPHVGHEEAGWFGSFTGIGEVTFPVSSPVKTAFVKTFVANECLFDDVLPNFALRPMKMSPFMIDDDGTMEYPMIEALRPYAGEVLSVDVKSFSQAITIAMRPFAQATNAYQGRVWSIEEAFVGTNGAKGIPLGTSTGLPGCISFRNKRAMLGGMVDWDFTAPEMRVLIQEIEGLHRMLEQGIRPCFLVRGFLKDELRKPGKKARYIAGTNVHYYVLCRMYFGQIVSCQMSKYKDSGMCPGINPYQDWEWLYNYMHEKGDNAWDGDFSGFDTSQQPQMLLACCDYINEWYSKRGATKQENAIRSILFLDLMKSKHVVGRGSLATHVVQWQRSLPSGHFLTTFINSMFSMSCLVASFVKTTGRMDFWDCCRAATLGDDNLCSASDEVVSLFNQVTVAESLKEDFGMVYTAGRKEESLVPTVSWEKISFLQRKFSLKQERMVGPIRLESVFGCLMYMKKADRTFMEEVMKQNIEGVLGELSLHEERLWERSVSTVMDIARSVSYEPRFAVSTSQEYFDFTCNREDSGWF